MRRKQPQMLCQSFSLSTPAGDAGGAPVLVAFAESSRRCRTVSVAACTTPPLLATGDAQGNVFAFAVPAALIRPGESAAINLRVYLRAACIAPLQCFTWNVRHHFPLRKGLPLLRIEDATGVQV